MTRTAAICLLICACGSGLEPGAPPAAPGRSTRTVGYCGTPADCWGLADKCVAGAAAFAVCSGVTTVTAAIACTLAANLTVQYCNQWLAGCDPAYPHLGDSCTYTYQCGGSMHCVNGQCWNCQGSDGDRCGSDADCASGTCMPAYAGAAGGTCMSLKPNGSLCSWSYECQSNICYNNRCVACQPCAFGQQECGVDLYCGSGVECGGCYGGEVCNAVGHCITPCTPCQGQTCGYDQHCNSGQWCGGCDASSTCNAYGQCEAIEVCAPPSYCGWSGCPCPGSGDNGGCPAGSWDDFGCEHNDGCLGNGFNWNGISCYW